MTTTPPRRPSAPPPPRAVGATEPAPAGVVVGVRRLFRAESANYFLVLGTTLFLVVFGLIMVLSSSSVSSFRQTDDFFTTFLRQGMFAMLAVPLMLIVSWMPSQFWR